MDVAGVRVKENCKVHSSILCDSVVLKPKASVSRCLPNIMFNDTFYVLFTLLSKRGCVLSFGVIVGEGVVLPPYTRLSRISKKSKVFILSRVLCCK